MDWKKYVGKRVLVRKGWERFARDLGPTEVEVLEVSRSGEYVKFKYPNTGHTSWVKAGDVEFVECLDEVEAVRMEYVSKIVPELIWFSQDSFSIVGKDEQERAATIVIKYDETIEINGEAVVPSEIGVHKDGFVIGWVTFPWGREIEIKCHNPMAVVAEKRR